MPRWLSNALLILEALICFGPIAGVMLLGAFFLPLWLNMLIAYWTETVVPFDPEGSLPWDFIWPMVVVMAGIIGMIGLARVMSIVLRSEPRPQGRKMTIVLVAIGLGGLTLFNVALGGISPFKAPVASLIYWILPGLGSAHLLYLARDSLFPGYGKNAR